MTIQELLNSILTYASEKQYPDIHINTNQKIKIRNESGDIVDLNSIIVNGKEVEVPVMNKETIILIIKILVGERGLEKFENELEIDGSYSISSGERYRLNCYTDTIGYSIALRSIPSVIPDIDELGLGEHVKDMCFRSKGLILMTGPTGVGKSTNIASMLNHINNNSKKHIITIEDPVEFVIKSNKSLVNQREIGNHTKGFQKAIKATLREDPDVIMVGEMRDPETVKAVITLAETGHLVLSTLHTNDSVQTIDRIIDIFPSDQQKQIRMQLAMSLVGVISQRLIPRSDKEGRIAAREILISNDAIKNLIITGKTHQLYGVLEVGQKKGMILMDKYLIALYKKEIIDKETLISYIRDKEGIEMLID